MMRRQTPYTLLSTVSLFSLGSPDSDIMTFVGGIRLVKMQLRTSIPLSLCGCRLPVFYVYFQFSAAKSAMIRSLCRSAEDDIIYELFMVSLPSQCFLRRRRLPIACSLTHNNDSDMKDAKIGLHFNLFT